MGRYDGGSREAERMRGFSAMMGNPPWEVLSNEERAWFAGRHEDIANCTRTSTRRSMIAALQNSEDEADRKLFKSWSEESENTIRTRTFMSKSGAYPLTAKGTLNLAPMFAEVVVNFSRYSGVIIPSTVLTDISTRAHFVDLVSKGRLHDVLDLANQKPFFTQAGQNLRFVLLSVRQESKSKSFQCLGNQLRLPSTSNINPYTVTEQDLRVLYGDDPSCPMFPSMQAFHLAKQLALAWTRYNDEGGWEAQYGRMVDMAVDSHHFVTYEELNENANLTTDNGFLWRTTAGEVAYVPLYEAKLFDAHQPRFGDFSGVTQKDRFGRAARSKRPSDEDLSDPNYAPLPRYWVPVEVRDAWFKQRGVLDHQHGQVATRGICRGLTDSRSLKAAVLPNEVALGHSAGYWLAPEQDPEYPFVLATVLNSLLADYQARMYLTGINLSKYLVEMVYMPTPKDLRRLQAVLDGVESSVWNHLLSLSFHLHHEWNYLQHPLSNNSPERAVKNPLAAIDALLAKQAGLSRSMFEWMIGRFNIWERQIGTEALLDDRLQWFDAIQILEENLP